MATNIFAVEPKSHIIPLTHDIRDAPTRHDGYKIHNVGRADVVVSLLSTAGQYWQKIEEQATVKPGHKLTMDNVGKFCFISGIRIANNTDNRAIVYCAKVGGNSSEGMVTIDEPDPEEDLNEEEYPIEEQLEQPELGFYDEDEYEILKATYTIGVKYIDYVNPKYDGLVNAFWPSDRLSVWQEILTKLQPILDDDVLTDFSSFINKCMPIVRQQLISLSTDCNNNCEADYMKVAEDLAGFEEEFTSKLQNYKSKSSLLLLPLFSGFTFMKVTFYALGVINLPYTDQNDCKTHLQDTVNRATKYIRTMFEYQIKHTYNTSHPKDLFNSLMTVRTYTIIHGLEYLSVWKNMVQYPLGGTKGDIIGQISYSHFFGRQTPNLVREATSTKMCPPLTPHYYDLKSIGVYLWRSKLSQQIPKIGGMKLTFSDWSSYIMGTETEEYDEFELGQAYITKMEVTGDGAVDSVTFYISDGRQLPFGTAGSDFKKDVFELKDHMIVSLFLSSDNFDLQGQAANISVAFNKVISCRW